MKKISSIYALVICFCTYSFGATGNTYVPYSQRIDQCNHAALSHSGLARASQNNAKSLVWKLLSYRHDTYDDTTSVFNYSDSTIYGYDTWGNTDSEVYLIYSGGSWQYDQKVIYVYDANHNITYGIGYDWSSGSNAWVPFADVTETFNAGNKLLSQVYRTYISSTMSLRNDYQYTNTYDANNNELTDIYQLWDSTSNNWDNDSKTIYTYDASNNPLTVVYQNWDPGITNWVNFEQDLYTNDANGNQLTNILQDWYGSTWYNETKQLNTFDANNNKTENIYQTWDSINSVWDNNRKYDYTFDSNNNNTGELYYYWDVATTAWVNDYQYIWTFVNVNYSATELQQTWDNINMVWVNYYKYAYSYDGNFNETGYQDAYWNTGANAWYGNYNYTYTYDGNNNKIYELEQSFNTGNLTFENTDQYYFYYGQLNIQGIKEVANQLNTTLFPNPSNGTGVTLTTQLDNAAKVRITLYDAAGKPVTTQMQDFSTGSNNTTLNYNNISSGNYYIQVLEYTTGKSSILKFVKQ